MIKTRTWIVIIAALAVAAAGAILLIRFFGAPGTTAEIVKGGKVLYTIDLDRVAEEYEIEIGSGDGDRNVVTVKPTVVSPKMGVVKKLSMSSPISSDT